MEYFRIFGLFYAWFGSIRILEQRYHSLIYIDAYMPYNIAWGKSLKQTNPANQHWAYRANISTQRPLSIYYIVILSQYKKNSDGPSRECHGWLQNSNDDANIRMCNVLNKKWANIAKTHVSIQMSRFKWKVSFRYRQFLTRTSRAVTRLNRWTRYDFGTECMSHIGYREDPQYHENLQELTHGIVSTGCNKAGWLEPNTVVRNITDGNRRDALTTDREQDYRACHVITIIVAWSRSNTNAAIMQSYLKYLCYFCGFSILDYANIPCLCNRLI